MTTLGISERERDILNHGNAAERKTVLGTKLYEQLPTLAEIAALRAYAPKSPVRAATTAALPACVASGTGIGKTLTGSVAGALAAQDGVTLVAGDRILVKDQVAKKDNGIYEVTRVGGATTFILTRTSDADESDKVIFGMQIAVREGTRNRGQIFLLSTIGPITLDTTPLIFVPTRILFKKEPVRLATTAALVATAAGTGIGKTLTETVPGGAALQIDGVTTALGDRILVKDQAGAAAKDNGIYVLTQQATAAPLPYILTRATDCDEDSEVRDGMEVDVEAGTTNGSHAFQLQTNNTITLDTTLLSFGISGGINTPSDDQKAALAGTGTPSGTNLFVTYDTLLAVARNMDWKDSCRAATTGALVATGAGHEVGKTLTEDAPGAGVPLSIDGVPLNVGDRVLVKDQGGGTHIDNGIYTLTRNSAAGAPNILYQLTRATDADQDAEVTSGLATHINEGTANSDQDFYLTTNDPITVDGTALTFALNDRLPTANEKAGLGVNSPTALNPVQTLKQTQTRPSKVFVRASTAAALPAYTAAGGPGPARTLTEDPIAAPIGTQIDGVAVQVGNRVLVKNGVDPHDNGIYTVTALGNGGADPWVLTRAVDADETDEVFAGLTVFVSEGAVNAGYEYRMTSAGAIVIDTDPQVYEGIVTAAALRRFPYKNLVRQATIMPLPDCVAAGAGPGKTLTAGANGALTVDGVAAVINTRILVKDQVDPVNNGIYLVTNPGAGGAPFVLTRALDADDLTADTDLVTGVLIPVLLGNLNGQKVFKLITAGALTIDTSQLYFMPEGYRERYPETQKGSWRAHIGALDPDMTATTDGVNGVVSTPALVGNRIMWVQDGGNAAAGWSRTTYGQTAAAGGPYIVTGEPVLMGAFSISELAAQHVYQLGFLEDGGGANVDSLIISQDVTLNGNNNFWFRTYVNNVAQAAINTGVLAVINTLYYFKIVFNAGRATLYLGTRLDNMLPVATTTTAGHITAVGTVPYTHVANVAGAGGTHPLLRTWWLDVEQTP